MLYYVNFVSAKQFYSGMNLKASIIIVHIVVSTIAKETSPENQSIFWATRSSVIMLQDAQLDKGIYIWTDGSLFDLLQANSKKQVKFQTRLCANALMLFSIFFSMFLQDAQ